MRAFALSLLALAACTIPASDFHATATDDAGDQHPGPTITVVTSVDSLSIDEASTATVNVHLASPPDGDLVVSAVLDAGPVTASPSMLVFNATNFDADQTITLSSATDSNTVNEDQVLTLRADHVPDRAVAITSIDKDVQNIKVAPSSVAVKEQGTPATLQVSLTQQPSTSVKVTLTSATGKAHVDLGQLTFTPQNYATVQTVMVDGVSDADVQDDTDTITLAATDPDTGGTLSRSVPVAITDDDRIQMIKVSAASVAVEEGSSGGFDVSLLYDPGTTVTVTLSDDDPAKALPIDKTSIVFNSTSYATPVHVTVKPPVDANTTSETASVTLSGGGAPATTTVALTATDKTVVDTFGWPDTFSTTTAVSTGLAVAYKVNVSNGDTLDAFHTYVSAGVGEFRMALYTDNNDVPGDLVAQMGNGQVTRNGTNDGPALTPVQLTSASYFVVVRFSASNNIGYATAATTGRQCVRNVPYSAITDPWTSPFGASTCQTAPLINVWITAHHQ